MSPADIGSLAINVKTLQVAWDVDEPVAVCEWQGDDVIGL